MNVSGTVCQCIHYFPGRQGLAIDPTWPALKVNNARVFDIISWSVLIIILLAFGVIAMYIINKISHSLDTRNGGGVNWTFKPISIWREGGRHLFQFGGRGGCHLFQFPACDPPRFFSGIALIHFTKWYQTSAVLFDLNMQKQATSVQNIGHIRKSYQHCKNWTLSVV